jgi:hypothetical protein
MTDEAGDVLRAVAMALPESTEDHEGVGSPAFKVRGKIFAMRHPHNDRPSMWCKAPAGVQDALVGSDPERFFVPPYVGHHGWIGLWLDRDVDPDELADLVEESYRMTAPKRLLSSCET